MATAAKKDGKAQAASVTTNVTTSTARETADLTLRLLEYLALQPGQCGVTDLAREFGTSKTTIHRHLRTLVNREFVRQDVLSLRYEPGIKLFQLGERLRERFGILGAARAEMERLRNESGQAVTLSTLVHDKVLILDLVQGNTVVEFGIRPGTQMDLHSSAHGKVALAFGPAQLLETFMTPVATRVRRDSGLSGALLRKRVVAARKQGWATAANEVVFGVNALAAPVFDHRGSFAGTIAIVGSTQYIGSKPEAKQLAMVTDAARRISKNLGWRGD